MRGFRFIRSLMELKKIYGRPKMSTFNIRLVSHLSASCRLDNKHQCFSPIFFSLRHLFLSFILFYSYTHNWNNYYSSDRISRRISMQKKVNKISIVFLNIGKVFILIFFFFFVYKTVILFSYNNNILNWIEWTKARKRKNTIIGKRIDVVVKKKYFHI